MPNYCGDMMHCSQDQCKKRDQCYRYWLGQESKRLGNQQVSYYCPEEAPVTDGCGFFVRKEYFD